MMSGILRILTVAAATSFIVGTAVAQAGIPVTPENYAEAEVDVSAATIIPQIGSNKFRHDRSLMPLDKQPAVTMNRDTVYSFGMFYTPKGTTITLPPSKDNRYQSAMMLQTDDYVDQVFYAPGTFTIDSQTEFTIIVIRTQVDATNPADMKYVNSLQDQITVKLPAGVKAKDYVLRDWDKTSLLALRRKYQEEAKSLPDLNKTMGARGTVDPELHRMGAAIALGLLPPEDAVYIYRDYGLKGSECYKATYSKPGFKDKGFFSLTMYGADKYLHDEKSTLNNRVLKYNADGTFTVYYGPKAKWGNVSNYLNTPGDNWYLGMRVYRPVASIIDGNYDMPVPTLVSR
jgi:hypothetical protein